jgi:hypothetical protein
MTQFEFTYEARETLRAAGLSTTAWAKLHGDESEKDWHGDQCGCTDDRCTGYHHDATEECGCLPALIEEHRKQQRASAAGREVWAAHMRATETGTTADRAAADRLAAAWITDYYPGTLEYSLTESPGWITCRNQYNGRTWHIFDAASGQAK